MLHADVKSFLSTFMHNVLLKKAQKRGSKVGGRREKKARSRLIGKTTQVIEQRQSERWEVHQVVKEIVLGNKQ
jgi:hypothetical protein